MAEREIHKATLLIADKATSDGRIYPLDLCKWLANRLGQKPDVIVQELSTLERRLKKISEAEPWLEKAMAIVIGGEMEDDKLVFYFRCKTSRDGKKLEGMIRQYGINNIDFIPVGYGEFGENGKVKPGYQFNYIAIENKEIPEMNNIIFSPMDAILSQQRYSNTPKGFPTENPNPYNLPMFPTNAPPFMNIMQNRR